MTKKIINCFLALCVAAGASCIFIGRCGADPFVSLYYPTGGAGLSGVDEIIWDASDPDLSATLTCWVNLSSDGGATYPTVVASNLTNTPNLGGPPQVTSFDIPFYTLNYANGSNYRLEVLAMDNAGVTATAALSSSFSINNTNYPPVVSVTRPETLHVYAGVNEITWTCSDPNGADQHTYEVRLSSDGGSTFSRVVSTGLTVTAASWSTAQYPNAGNYVVRVVATDNGAPALSGQGDSGVFFINNAPDTPPGAFSLLSPSDHAWSNAVTVTASWQAAVDTNVGDYVGYTLLLSRDNVTYDPVTITTQTTAVLDRLSDQTTYYWKVRAQDVAGRTTLSTQTFSFRVSRAEAFSPDGNAHITLNTAFPGNALLSIAPVGPSADAHIAQANTRASQNPAQASLGGAYYDVTLTDGAGHLIDPSGLQGTLSLPYTDANNDGVLDGTMVRAESLKVFWLNSATAQWEQVPGPQTLDKNLKTITVAISHFSVYSLLGSADLAALLSGIHNFPNPFKAGKENTTLSYVLTENCTVDIVIYDALGGLVKKISFSPGQNGGTGLPGGFVNTVLWDGKNGQGMPAASGYYLAQIKAVGVSGASSIQTLKMAVLK